MFAAGSLLPPNASHAPFKPHGASQWATSITMLRSTPIVATLLVVISGLENSQAVRYDPTYELQIFREPTVGPRLPCSLVSLHETQTHKDLLASDANAVISWSQSFYQGEGSNRDNDSFERYFSLDAHLLWDIATTECGPLSSTTLHVGPSVPLVGLLNSHEDPDQAVLGGSDSLRTLPPAPELEVFPLITSGNSANRIDFVFFGDGCKSFPTVSLSKC